MTNTETAAPQVSIYAASMLAAQGVKLTAEQRTALVAKADQFRRITGTTGKTSVNVPVFDMYQPTVKIGYMTYSL
jgi:hypothetical protein